MNAPLLPQPQRELHPIPPPEEPWTHCGIDLVCDLPTNSKGLYLLLFAILPSFHTFISYISLVV